MDLVNNTPLAAKVFLGHTGDETLRNGMVVAKATYRFDASGAISLEADAPFPIFEDDHPTALGLLPRDNLPRLDTSFEVILLGSAHAPGGKAVDRMKVSLQVGDVRRDLMVWGDRVWQGEGDDATISAPVPFIRMPLTWARAFGGTTEVLIDQDAPVDIAHPLNPEGRGIDPLPAAAALSRQINAPDDYPRCSKSRLLPNLEDPKEPISQWDDNPSPICWAAVPFSSGIQGMRMLEAPAGETADPLASLSEGLTLKKTAFHRAHPLWVISPPGRDTSVVLHGLSMQEKISFSLPTLRATADYVVGERQGIRQLNPCALVILAEQHLFYLLFRHDFTMPFHPKEERCMRLCIKNGWFTDDGGGPS